LRFFFKKRKKKKKKKLCRFFLVILGQFQLWYMCCHQTKELE
jgi:hypothetical protein